MSEKRLYLIFFAFFCILNLPRFFYLETSPPGFYTDEAASATQALCISQGGYDFYGQFLPLFPKGFEGGGVFTPFYIYGEILWTKLFGPSITAFRSFPAFITCLTIFALYVFVKNKANKPIALYVVFIASLMPWAFQFSRIAWDPPLATFFFVSALAVLFSQKKLWLTGILFAFAMYSYPPMRISVPLFLLMIPSIGLVKKCQIVGWMSLASIPLLLQYLDPNFMSHAKDLAIWSNPSLNPYPQLGLLGFVQLFFENMTSHFTGTFLFNRGDANLRSSIQSFGMLSLVDKFALLSVPISYLIFWIRRASSNKPAIFLLPDQSELLKIAFLGVIVNIIPAALTIEGNPHALRAIGAWPFFAILSGLFIYRLGTLTYPRIVAAITLLVGIVFFTQYLNSYLNEYPKIAKNAFKINNNGGIDYAYEKIAKDGFSCASAKNAVYQSKLDKPFDFSYSSTFLRNGWHTPEDWGVWSNNSSAYLSIPMPSGNPKALIFSVSVFLSQRFPTQELTVFINGKRVISENFINQNKADLVLPLPLLAKEGDGLEVEFRISQLRSPKESGISGDDRGLGIALYSGEFISNIPDLVISGAK
jgi:hypothetical protein